MKQLVMQPCLQQVGVDFLLQQLFEAQALIFIQARQLGVVVEVRECCPWKGAWLHDGHLQWDAIK
jgi:hypothetical protein